MSLCRGINGSPSSRKGVNCIDVLQRWKPFKQLNNLAAEVPEFDGKSRNSGNEIIVQDSNHYLFMMVHEARRIA